MIGSRSCAAVVRCDWPGCAIPCSSTDWSRSSSCRSRVGADGARSRRDQRVASRTWAITSACVPGPGFTAPTGETGAGKTMVLTALEMLLGGRVDAGIAEGPASKASGRSRPTTQPSTWCRMPAGRPTTVRSCWPAPPTTVDWWAFAGGRMVPASLLADIGQRLVTVHGQSTQQRLRNPSAQRAALDRFGGPKHQELVTACWEAYAAWREVAAALESARQGLQQNQQRMLFLQSALEEIEKPDPQPGSRWRCRPSSGDWATWPTSAPPPLRPAAPSWVMRTPLRPVPPTCCTPQPGNCIR